MNIEGLHGAADQEIEKPKSDFEQALSELRGVLETKGLQELQKTIENLSDREKMKLDSALNENGQNWNLLGKLPEEDEAKIAELIAAWNQESALTQDKTAQQKVNKRLIKALESL
ncbi:MAG TPA: hypothetical protein VMU07_03575 [Candidatus Paceibacterota bacterium]|nr:hypothetical protein [Candidatus Paceibacterota bacterium]